MALRDWLTIDDLLRPAMLVSWAVPAARVRPHVPAPLLLDTVPGPGGDPLALLTVAAVLNVNMHARLAPRLRLTFAQANYRTYVQPHAGGPTGVYFFGNFISARLPWLPTWLASPNVYYGPARMAGRVPRTQGGAWQVRLELASPLGPTILDAGGSCEPGQERLLWPDATKGTHFLTHRLLGYYRDRWGGVGLLPVEHVEMQPWTGQVHLAVCGPWQHWGLLSAAEVAHPLSVLVDPSVRFRAYPPRRVRSAN